VKKACVIPLALYLLVAAVVGAVVYRRFPEVGPALLAGFIGGFILFLGLGYLYGIRGKVAESRMIRRALSGVPPQDGKKYAAIGRLVPNGPPVTSPFTKTTAVACKYEIQTVAGKGMATLYSGFAMNPSSIQGRHGTVRLLAYPDLKVSSSTTNSDEARRNAEQYIASTKFRDATAGKLRESLAEMMALYKDDDGTIRYDQRNAGAESTNLGYAQFLEWIVKPGEQVCVIGHYSAQRSGLVYDPSNPLDQVKIEVGEPDGFAGRAMRSAVGYFIAGVVIVTICAAALTAFLVNVPLEASEQMNPELRVSWPEVRFERWLEARVRTPLREAGMLGSWSVSNDVSAGVAKGRVNDTLVTQAEAEREGDRTIVHVGDDAIVLTLDGNGSPTALRLNGTEIPRERWPGSLDVQISSLDSQLVRGRITFFSDDQSLPLARATFAALIHDRE
jgi:hypothetical protein